MILTTYVESKITCTNKNCLYNSNVVETESAQKKVPYFLTELETRILPDQRVKILYTSFHRNLSMHSLLREPD